MGHTNADKMKTDGHLSGVSMEHNVKPDETVALAQTIVTPALARVPSTWP